MRFGDRTSTFSKDQKKILAALDEGLETRGLVSGSLGTRSAHGCAAVVGALVAFVVAVAVLGFGLGLVLTSLFGWSVAVPLAGAVIGVVAAAVGLAQVRRAARGYTSLGLGATRRVAGFERFFEGSEDLHARVAADAGLLRQYMGYAVAFDAVDRWVDAFDAPDLTWMGTDDPRVVDRWVTSSLFLAAATPPAPVSSGSRSSGFGGGGFGGGFGGGGVGGGSGGGGGGSW